MEGFNKYFETEKFSRSRSERRVNVFDSSPENSLKPEVSNCCHHEELHNRMTTATFVVLVFVVSAFSGSLAPLSCEISSKNVE